MTAPPPAIGAPSREVTTSSGNALLRENYVHGMGGKKKRKKKGKKKARSQVARAMGAY